jgi:SAM-dependent methyltransferase
MTTAPSGFRPESFDILVDIEEDSFWFQARNDLLIWALGRYFPQTRDLLEIGCGTGFVLAGLHRAYPQVELTGAELYEEGLVHARTRLPDVELIQLDARRIGEDRQWDVIGAFDVLEHIDADTQVLAEMHRAVRPGGGILLTVPQHPWLWGAADEYACHERRYTQRELVDKVVAAGFRTVRVTSWVSLLMPVLVLSRLLERHSSKQYDPRAEHAQAERVGRVLGRIMRAELNLVRRGARLPIGGSLFLVATRA